jgi:hypothetical protein
MTGLARDIHVSKRQRGLTDPRLSLQDEGTQAAERSGKGTKETLEIMVDDGGDGTGRGRSGRSPACEAPISSFSGGERYRVPIALRMGLATMPAACSGIPADVRLIDEPTDLDKTGVGYLAALLATPASRRCSSPTRTSSSPRCPSGSSSSAPPTPLRARWPWHERARPRRADARAGLGPDPLSHRATHGRASGRVAACRAWPRT